MVRGAEEAGRERDQLPLRGRRIVAVEARDHDLLDALDVEELEGQCPAAGGVESLEAVALGQAQELLRLAQLRPRERTGE